MSSSASTQFDEISYLTSIDDLLLTIGSKEVHSYHWLEIDRPTGEELWSYRMNTPQGRSRAWEELEKVSGDFQVRATFSRPKE